MRRPAFIPTKATVVRVLAVAAVVTLILSGAASGCQTPNASESPMPAPVIDATPPNLGGGGDLSLPGYFACGTQLVTPRMSDLIPGGVMTATISRCDQPIVSHDLTVGLDRRTGAGAWIPALPSNAGAEFEAACFDVPEPGREVLCEYHTDRCIDGVYRPRVKVVAAGRDDLAYWSPSEADLAAHTAVITCPKK